MKMHLWSTCIFFYTIAFLGNFSSAAKLHNNVTDTTARIYLIEVKNEEDGVKNVIIYTVEVFSISEFSFSPRKTSKAYRMLPEGLSIENLQLKNKKTTKATPVITTSTFPTITEKPNEIIYRLNGNNGYACILISTDAVVDFDYETNIGEIRDKPVYLPVVYEAKGSCDKPDEAYITVLWEGFEWSVYFSKTPGGEHWYVSKMEMSVDSKVAASKVFEHIKIPPKDYKFSTPTDRSTMLFPTPVGKAYKCLDEITIEMRDEDIVAILLLRELKMQPFIFKKNGFGPEFVCTPGGAKSYRSETAPIAVGSTLAIVTLLTVTGYGIYRYMKVKKVQYDTME